ALGADVGRFADAGRLAAASAQIIELRAANLAAANQLDLLHDRRVDREDALHSLAVGNLADREALVESAALATDHHALIGLEAGAGALRHTHVDAHRVAGLERGKLAFFG